MDNKTMSLVSYIFTPIGWLISFFSYKGQEKSSLVSYHLRQSFGLFLIALVVGILMSILAFISLKLALAVYWIYWLISLGFFVLMIIGILNAAKGEENPLPFIGKMFEGKFNFIP
jgi:uncharacterized membrane protein